MECFPNGLPDFIFLTPMAEFKFMQMFARACYFVSYGKQPVVCVQPSSWSQAEEMKGFFFFVKVLIQSRDLQLLILSVLL